MRALVAGLRWFGGLSESVTAALRANGLEVTEFTCRDYRRFGRNRILEAIHDRAKPFGLPFTDGLQRLDRHICQAKLIRIAKDVKPDLFLVLDEDYVERATVEAVRDLTGAICAAWLVDDPFAMARFPFAAPVYHHVFVFDRHYVSSLRSFTAGEVSYLPLAGDDTIFYRTAKRQHGCCGLVHVGTWYAERERTLLEARADDLEIYGWDRRHCGALSGAVRARRIPRAETNKLYNRAWAVLSLHHSQVKRAPTRVFDPALSGAFQLTEARDDHGELFEPGVELETFRSYDELHDKLGFYRDHVDTRNQIARLGMLRAQREHTFRLRVQTLLKALGVKRQAVVR